MFRTLSDPWCLKKMLATPCACRSILFPPRAILRGGRYLSSASMRPPPWWVLRVNAALEAQPLVTLGSYAAMDACSMGVFFYLYSFLSVDVPVELAVAYGVSRVLRRLRMPLDLAVGALLARAVPSLTEVKLLEVVQRPLQQQLGGAAPPKSAASALSRMAFGAGALVNTYGLAYLVASRCIVGMASVGSIYACLRTGFDVQGALSALGDLSPVPAAEAGAAAGKAAGWWAAAALTAAPLLPLNILVAAGVGNAVQARRK